MKLFAKITLVLVVLAMTVSSADAGRRRCGGGFRHHRHSGGCGGCGSYGGSGGCCH
jgi:hypothetical protein